jgi:hypothetical protein
MTPSIPAGADGTTPFGRTIDYSKCRPDRWSLDAHELIWLASSDPDNQVTRFPSSSVHRYLFRTPLIRWQPCHRRQFDVTLGLEVITVIGCRTNPSINRLSQPTPSPSSARRHICFPSSAPTPSVARGKAPLVALIADE